MPPSDKRGDHCDQRVLSPLPEHGIGRVQVITHPLRNAPNQIA